MYWVIETTNGGYESKEGEPLKSLAERIGKRCAEDDKFTPTITSIHARTEERERCFDKAIYAFDREIESWLEYYNNVFEEHREYQKQVRNEYYLNCM